ncbi:hypothetical protein FD755_012235 [Muntiacus reevesi]|uniref:60S ribosomal protein L37a n=1 Tax=Muntiacus reevesi TaxID=9886 RepID=A0A5N3XQQ2_MUNRE|nr:hypothetical protein FD755_012235 [Muntiacus reevesi]
MMKRTEDVRIMGKYRTNPGASLRKMVRKIELSQHANYTCSFCGKTKMTRCAGVTWLCGSRMRAVAGGAGPTAPPLLSQASQPSEDWRN